MQRYFGQEMVESYNEDKPMPTMLQPSPKDTANETKLKEIIQGMIGFQSRERTDIKTVTKSLEGINLY